MTEGGTYSYDSSKWRRYVLGTWAHNTILVDGQEQRRRSVRESFETDQPLDNLWITNAVFDAADGRYTDGYGKEAIPVVHQRTVIFL
ncbi:MAG: heparinase II/III-family protein, partial [Microthrixaceae bacterium]|nr:heparinase II/III-family protein [Microthrixaceae bacterium]